MTAAAVLQDVELCKLSLLPALQIIAKQHPEQAWREAAAAAAELLVQSSDR
jgi:hypothetical protein